MIFRADEIQRIRSRSKTQVRLPVLTHPAWGFEVPCRYRPGGMYAIRRAPDWTAASLRVHQRVSQRTQPTRARAVVAYLTGPVESPHVSHPRPTGLHLTVMDVRQERLGDISREDVRREGMRFAGEFETLWRRQHGAYDPAAKVWVVSFEYGDQRHKFDRDLFMKATPGVYGLEAEEHQDYTTQPALAMRGEPPVMDPALQKRLSHAASERDDQQRRERAHRERMARRAA
ncbi:MAG TPA: hypothetical protein VFH80_10255 [Solirubrobacteraceae bacterium]|nr:hypothetical protein [Solirubrobacteraceae bacterium]